MAKTNCTTLKKDPHEIKNIINQPSARTGLTLMQAELKRLLDETSTQKPARSGRWSIGHLSKASKT